MMLAILVPTVLIGWRWLPGLLGEWVGTMVGLVSTPFILELSFAILGLTIVIAINHVRQKKEGDELVYLEQVEGPDIPENLPEHARFAVYPRIPLEGLEPGLLARAEGEWALGDGEAALRSISQMSDPELRDPATLALRIEIARATGKADLAAKLETQRRKVTELSS